MNYSTKLILDGTGIIARNYRTKLIFDATVITAMNYGTCASTTTSDFGSSAFCNIVMHLL